MRRIPVGGALATVAYAALVDAAEELLAGESHDFYARAFARREMLEQAWRRSD